MTSTYTQAAAEDTVRAALATATGMDPERETVSDAVDIYLSRAELDHQREFDRDAIPREVVLAVRDTIVRNAHDHG